MIGMPELPAVRELVLRIPIIVTEFFYIGTSAAEPASFSASTSNKKS